VLERGVHGRHLQNLSGKAGQQGFDVSQFHLYRTHFQDVAFGIARGRGYAEACFGHVGLVRIEQILRKLGRLTQAQRQHAAGERIETPGMAALAGVEQPAHFLQRGIGCHAQRLVKNKHAVDITALSTRCRHALLL
jgi:hypothetical protein